MIYLLRLDYPTIDVIDVEGARVKRSITFDIPAWRSDLRLLVQSGREACVADDCGNRTDLWMVDAFVQPSTSWRRWFAHWERRRPPGNIWFSLESGARQIRALQLTRLRPNARTRSLCSTARVHDSFRARGEFLDSPCHPCRMLVYARARSRSRARISPAHTRHFSDASRPSPGCAVRATSV
jgi:hypothetical protein